MHSRRIRKAVKNWRTRVNSKRTKCAMTETLSMTRARTTYLDTLEMIRGSFFSAHS